MNKIHLAGLFLIALLMSGCSTTGATRDITIDAEADPKAKFSGYKSYAWLGSAAILQDTTGRWEPPQFDADAEIRFLIDRELRKRGMSEDSVDPDMLVAYAAGIDMDTLEVKVDPQSGIKTLENVPQGALVIALLDAQTSVAVWAGLATANVQQNPDHETVKARLDHAVTSMIRKLPR